MNYNQVIIVIKQYMYNEMGKNIYIYLSEKSTFLPYYYLKAPAFQLFPIIYLSNVWRRLEYGSIYRQIDISTKINR